MDNKQFKKYFGVLANKNKFKSAFGNWYIESDEVIIVLQLQKSNYGNLYYLNIKIYIHNLFGQKYTINKFLVKNDIGDIFTRLPNEYNILFDLVNELEDKERQTQLEEMFVNYINNIINKALTIDGIKKLYDNKEIHLLPAVKEALYNLTSKN